MVIPSTPPIPFPFCSFPFISYVTCIYTMNSVNIYQIAHKFCLFIGQTPSDIADLVNPMSGTVDDNVLVTLRDLFVDVADD